MSDMDKVRKVIADGRAVLGIEFGSTRIKAVLIGEEHEIIATGIHDWENRLENGIWTYSREEIIGGLKAVYSNLSDAVMSAYGIRISKLAAMGISAMMHGYLALDDKREFLAPFKTWRNTTTQLAASELTRKLHFNIPQRWSIAHLYNEILNKEEHLARIDYLTTLDGFIHYLLTGEKVLGIGSASGMFPIDSEKKDYDEERLAWFEELAAQKGFDKKLRSILPKVLVAGEMGGHLTQEGARILDEAGYLEPGCVLAPPEGDAGTGMVATNAVREKSGNVSAGTSIFSMIVLEHPFKSIHEEVDLVTTPDGKAVGMIHCNNCSSDINAWVSVFRQYSELMGMGVDTESLYQKLFDEALNGAKDCGGVMSYNLFSGEPILGISEGRPLLMRSPKADFSLANLMRSILYSAFATLKIGNDILKNQEQVEIDSIVAHGGLFKTKGVAQSILAAALNVPVTVLETGAEGGPWGMAILASYMIEKSEGESLADYLERAIFTGCKRFTVNPDKDDVLGFERYTNQYLNALAAEKEAGRFS